MDDTDSIVVDFQIRYRPTHRHKHVLVSLATPSPTYKEAGNRVYVLVMVLCLRIN